jgi:hypothetical protein
MHHTPKLPEGWSAWGSLPSFDPACGGLSEQQLFELSEDLWHATSPDGSKVLDVGWYPEATEDGEFQCRLVRNGDWENAGVFATRSVEDAVGWIQTNLGFPDSNARARDAIG